MALTQFMVGSVTCSLSRFKQPFTIERGAFSPTLTHAYMTLVHFKRLSVWLVETLRVRHSIPYNKFIQTFITSPWAYELNHAIVVNASDKVLIDAKDAGMVEITSCHKFCTFIFATTLFAIHATRGKFRYDLREFLVILEAFSSIFG
jgi:hypothetical protein